MDKEFLENYSAKEIEEREVYLKTFSPDQEQFFPPRNRFRKLQDPICFQAPGESPWSQIPFCGSLIIPLFPVNKQKFEETHGFSYRMIDKLIDMVHDSGRVQFGLAANPTDFIDLEHYDSIFEEITPPVLRSHLPISALGNEEKINHYRAEFLEIANLSELFVAMDGMFTAKGFSNTYPTERKEGFITAYVILKILGYTEVTNKILDLLIDDIDQAHKFLYFYKHYVTDPMIRTIPGVLNTTMRYVKTMNEIRPSQGHKSITFPIEIGQFLMKKVVPYAESFEACQHVLLTFENEDLLKVIEALHQAVRKSNVDNINNETSNLDEILDNVWKDTSRIEKLKKLVSQSVPLGLAAIGYVAGGPITAVGGFLAGLGFEVANTAISNKIDSISEKLPKAISPNYLAALYDFKKKYSLK